MATLFCAFPAQSKKLLSPCQCSWAQISNIVLYWISDKPSTLFCQQFQTHRRRIRGSAPIKIHQLIVNNPQCFVSPVNLFVSACVTWFLLALTLQHPKATRAGIPRFGMFCQLKSATLQMLWDAWSQTRLHWRALGWQQVWNGSVYFLRVTHSWDGQKKTTRSGNGANNSWS